MLLGAAEDAGAARALISKYRKPDAAGAALESVKESWRSLLGYVNVRTPDPAFNVMMNGWLVYQTLSCRMWARSGFYQASGAYGFRDQLQDSMTVTHVQPRHRASTHPDGGVAPVQRRRRPALVASGYGCGRAHQNKR